MNTKLTGLYDRFVKAIGETTWESLRRKVTGRAYDLTQADHGQLRKLLAANYYIILTRRNAHLTTYLIQAGAWLTTGTPSRWSHCLMNMEGDDPVLDTDFRLMEATGTGVHYSDFMDVFDCDWAALLTPKHLSVEDWTVILDGMVKQNGKPYDTLFDLADATRVSCVELIRASLQGIPGYAEKFQNFEKLIAKHKVLTPQMYYDCGDFEVTWEARR